jgi:CheY-like chemotaxis protein
MVAVLVVDDSPIDRRLAQRILERGDGLTVQCASNGSEALDLIRKQPPDIIVTDLQMPELDGLELVGLVRSSFPLVPVVLMTAHGSEQIAVQALQNGAASYVPKARLGNDLRDTVFSVLAVARADRTNDRLFDCLKLTTMRFELDSDPALVFPLVDHIQQLVGRLKSMDDTGRIRVGIAVEEALLNALYHGNLELSADDLSQARDVTGNAASLIQERMNTAPYSKRKIEVTLEFSPTSVKVSIRDEGPGFDPASAVGSALPAAIEKPSGRGLLLIRTFMDDVQFNAQGNQITFVKNGSPAGGASAKKGS